jgi:arginyl-tRNA synthetase
MYLTREEYEQEIAALKSRLEAEESVSRFYFDMLKDSDDEAKVCSKLYEEMRDKYELLKVRYDLCKEVVKKRGRAIEWLMERVPFWTRKRFWKEFGSL